MKTVMVRFLSLLLALTALAFTAYGVFQSIQSFGVGILSPRILLLVVFRWPAQLVSILTHPVSILSLSSFSFVQLAVHIGAVIASILLANSLNHSSVEWGTLNFVFPYLLLVLAFLRNRPVGAETPRGPIRLILSLNVTLIGIAFFGGLGLLFGAFSGYAGGYAATWAVNRFVSSDVGLVLRMIEGLLVGLVATIALVVLASVIMALFSFLGSMGFSTIPVFTMSGDWLGSILVWVGGDMSGAGCALALLGSIPVGPIVGVIAGVSLGRGGALDPGSVGNIAGLVVAILGGLGGLAVGFCIGRTVWRSGGVWPGVLAGLVDGVIVGQAISFRWLEVVVLAVVGAIVGAVLAKMTQVKSIKSQADSV